ncbi:permease-like cell division protein FtsX [soil metagenome]
MAKPARTAWNHLRRSPYQALAAIFIMTQTFFVISLFVMLILGSAKIINYFESIPRVSVFFKNETKQESIDTLSEELKKSDQVESVRFISKKEAMQIYKNQVAKDDPLLMDLVTEDVLPAAVEISAKKIDDLPQVVTLLSPSASLIDKIIFPKDVVANLVQWTNALRKVGLGTSIILALDSIFIMVIIISIKISQKKEEIEIMKLLSATNWYIRRPFLLEGILYGVIGAFLGWLLASGTLMYFTPFLKTFLGDIPLLPVSPLFYLLLLGGEVLIAVILGMTASFLAVLRFLK